MIKVNHFSDLSLQDQYILIDHIFFNYKMIPSINYQQTAYGLKARFNRFTGVNIGHQITSQCFMEAMVKAGYKAIPAKKDVIPNWYFNVGGV
jgi:hypothetical protein